MRDTVVFWFFSSLSLGKDICMNSAYDFRVMRVLRRQLGLTLQEVARRSGLTYPTVESVETNKTLPSLKTLDAIAGALQISAQDLVGLAERRLVQRRTAQPQPAGRPGKGETGEDRCRVACFDQGKFNRVSASAGEEVHVMALHENVHEFCYVLSGRVELRIGDRTYDLGSDDTILFDGLLDHSYRQVETGEYVTAHIPKDIRIIERLLEVEDGSSSDDPPA